MKFLLVLLTLFISACTVMEPARAPDTGTVPAAPVTPRVAPEAPIARYLCNSGETVAIRFRENGLALRYRNKTHRLVISESASGARYVGDGLVWWNKGVENTLYTLVNNTDTGELLEKCREIVKEQ